MDHRNTSSATHIPIKPSNLNRSGVPLVVWFAADARLEPVQEKLFDNQSLHDYTVDILGKCGTSDALKDKSTSANYAIRMRGSLQYVNEANRAELLAVSDKTRFHEVELCFTLSKEVENFVRKLRAGDFGKSLELLVTLERHLTADKNFASEFHAKTGTAALLGCVREAAAQKWPLLLHVYKCLAILVQQRRTSWDAEEPQLCVKLICDTLNTASKTVPPVPDNLLLLFLQIANEIIQSTGGVAREEVLLKELKFADVLFLLQKESTSIREALLRLLNDLFRANETHKRALVDVLTYPQITTLLRETCKEETSHVVLKRLATLQKNLLDCKCGAMQLESEKCVKHLQFICKVAFECNERLPQHQPQPHVGSEAERLKRLGFEHGARDFEHGRHGAVALNFMLYFAEQLSLRTVLNSFLVERAGDMSFPFAKASIAMVEELCEMLKLGTSSVELDEREQLFYLMFCIRTTSRYYEGIYDFFAKCLCLFFKIWNDMKAQMLDFDRVLIALKCSVEKLVTDASKINSRQQSSSTQSINFKQKIENFFALMENYKYVKTIQVVDMANKAPVKELERLIADEVTAAIRPKRMRVLCKGERFERLYSRDKKTQHVRQKTFWKLSTDLSRLIYSIVSDTSLSSLEHCIEIESIKEVTKENVTTMVLAKEPSGGKPRIEHCFKIVYKRSDATADNDTASVLLCNEHEPVVDVWVEAIQMLVAGAAGRGSAIGKKTNSVTIFVECLKDVQLLDLKVLKYDKWVQDAAPAVPPLPADFDFRST